MTQYINFVYALKTLCEKHGLTLGGGGNTETGELKFGFRPKLSHDVEERDYLHNGLIHFRQLLDDPMPEFKLGNCGRCHTPHHEVCREFSGDRCCNCAKT